MGSALDRSQIALIIAALIFNTLAVNAAEPVFRFHFKNEVTFVDPAQHTSGTNSYLISTLYRGLTRYTDTGELIFDQAERCKYQTFSRIQCHLRKDTKWSDGSPVKAQDYVDSFLRFVRPESKSTEAALLFGS